MERLWIGMGCQADTGLADIDGAIQCTLDRHGLQLSAVVGLATLDTKESIGNLLCQQHHWQLRLFSAKELEIVQVPRPVTRVADLVGTPSVAEAAAYLAAGQLLVPKEIHRQDGKYITVAIGCGVDNSEVSYNLASSLTRILYEAPSDHS